MNHLRSKCNFPKEIITLEGQSNLQMNSPLDDTISLRLPVKISHQALEDFLRKKLIGENIKTEDKEKTTNYAQILGVSLSRSQNRDYDFSLSLKLKTLTKLFRNKEANLLVDVSIFFDRNEQVLTVTNFSLQVESSNWLLENSLETVANTLFHGKLKNKMKYDFEPLIVEQLQKINDKLKETLEASEGVFLSGFLSSFEIVDLLPGENLLLAIVELDARAILEIKKIDV